MIVYLTTWLIFQLMVLVFMDPLVNDSDHEEERESRKDKVQYDGGDNIVNEAACTQITQIHTIPKRIVKQLRVLS